MCYGECEEVRISTLTLQYHDRYCLYKGFKAGFHIIICIFSTIVVISKMHGGFRMPPFMVQCHFNNNAHSECIHHLAPSISIQIRDDQNLDMSFQSLLSVCLCYCIFLVWTVEE